MEIIFPGDMGGMGKLVCPWPAAPKDTGKLSLAHATHHSRPNGALGIDGEILLSSINHVR
jgi:hypothetical protein